MSLEIPFYLAPQQSNNYPPPPLRKLVSVIVREEVAGIDLIELRSLGVKLHNRGAGFTDDL